MQVLVLQLGLGARVVHVPPGHLSEPQTFRRPALRVPRTAQRRKAVRMGRLWREEETQARVQHVQHVNVLDLCVCEVATGCAQVGFLGGYILVHTLQELFAYGLRLGVGVWFSPHSFFPQACLYPSYLCYCGREMGTTCAWGVYAAQLYYYRTGRRWTQQAQTQQQIRGLHSEH